MTSSPRSANRAQNRRGHGSRLREELIAAGLQLLSEHGDEASVTLRGVARAAGVAAPSVYAHFDGPSDIVAAVVSAAYSQFARTVTAALGSQSDPAARLHAAVESYVRFAREHPGIYRVVFTRAHPSTLPEVGEAAGQLFTTLETLIISASTDELTPDRARARAVRLWIAVHGYATLRPSHPNFDWPRHEKLIADFIGDAITRKPD